MGVIMAVMGLTCLMVGTMAFPIATTWNNNFSITFIPVGFILLAGSAFIKWRLSVALLIPAGVVALAIGFMNWHKAAEETARLPYALPTIIGGALVLGAIAVNIPAMLRSGAARRGMVGANVFVMCFLALALAVVANLIASKYYHKRDLTESKKFTLASKTVEVAKSLAEPVEVTFVVTPVGPVYELSKSMIEDYVRLADGQMTVEYIDPVTENEKALAFFNDFRGDQVESVVFRTSHASKQIKTTELFEVDYAAMRLGSQTSPKYKGESEFTSALIKVTTHKKDVIYFTTGKGERAIQPMRGGEPGMSMRLKKYIENDNYEMKTINLAAQKIPEDCDILAIIGPKKPFSDQEIHAISRYLGNAKKPGKLLVALDPVVQQVQPSGLDPLLAEWGITVRQDVTAIHGDPLMGRFLSPLMVFAHHPRHEITEKMTTLSALFDIACMVEPAAPQAGPDGRPVPAPYEVASLAQTTENGWGETDISTGKVKYDPGVDPTSRPLSVAACSQQRDPNMPPPSPYAPPPQPDPSFNGSRIVVVGDSEFVTDASVGRQSTNIDFTLNCINWLAHKTTRLGIAAKPLIAPPIRISPQEIAAIFYGTLFGLPYLALVIGGIVYWRRSR